MSHVFPLRKTLPAIRRLSLATAIFVATIGAAYAVDKKPTPTEPTAYLCGTVASITAQLSAHPLYSTHATVGAAETARALQFTGDPDVPGVDAIDSGLLILRTDKVAVLIVFQKDGKCGALTIPPDAVERVLRAMNGAPA